MALPLQAGEVAWSGERKSRFAGHALAFIAGALVGAIVVTLVLASVTL